MKSIYVFTICTLLGSTLSAQTLRERCGPVSDDASPWADWYHDNKHRLAAERGDDTTWMYVPVMLHLTANDDGRGAYPLGSAIQDLCQLNSQFAPSRIRFYLNPGDFFRQHNNSSWHDHTYDRAGVMIDQTRVKGMFNIYVSENAAGACGYSWRDVIVNDKACSGPGNTTWAHEAGHHLSLPHTFRGWEGRRLDGVKPAPAMLNGRPVEKVDKSNCEAAADRFCDTSPDYLSDRWNCSTDGKSTARQFDPDSVAFRSDGTLYMGYANDACTNRFSPEQIAAMRVNLLTEHADYGLRPLPERNFDTKSSVSLVSPTDSQIVAFNNVRLSWKPVPGADYYIVQVGLDSRFSILLYNDAVRDTTVTITRGVVNNRNISWRVRPVNEWEVCGSTVPARIGVFRTRALDIISTGGPEDVLAAVDLSPNPVQQGQPVSMTVNAVVSTLAQLMVTDATGRVCQQAEIQIQVGENQYPVATQGMASGLYFVSVRHPKGIVTRRLAIGN
jgi:hypothetical protein